LKKSLLELYALAVCFTTIVCFVVALGIAIYDIIRIVSPEFTLSSYEYDRHQNNDAFWKGYKCGYDKLGKEMQRPPEEELTKQRLESYQVEVKSEQRSGYQGMTKSVIVLIIDILVFIVHWQIARRARETNVAT
jgi:hypothetical protein